MFCLGFFRALSRHIKGFNHSQVCRICSTAFHNYLSSTSSLTRFHRKYIHWFVSCASVHRTNLAVYRSNMSATSFCIFLVLSLAQSEISFSSYIGNPRNHPSGLLRRHKIKMQPKELVDECLDCQPLPTSADLGVHRLTQLIGGTLDGNLVSITKPTDFALSSQLKLRINTEALRELVINSTREMNINGGTLTKDQQTFLVSWLKSFSSCTLRRVWRDMGPFSWPRYIKRAYCESEKCSLVPTVQCLPSSRQFFSVLRWFCLRVKRNPQYVGRKNRLRRRRFWCRWIRYYQPITTGCS